MQVLGSTVVSPYVGMARKQNGSYNASISVQTLIFHLVVNSTRLKTVRSALWRCPNSTVALRLLENVVKVTNLEVVKIEFRHLPVLRVGSPMKKSDFHRSNRTPIQCMQAIDLYVKTTKRAMLTLSFLAEK